ncbi:hypothetical protein KQX54_020486 [Cotesia glomerata]|uniref:Heparan sulfate-N-deacetylase N-terminal domain-containing protein n=1 Tax=Cotesia glomerata TaxID=32391 RepID=A0AAV7JAA2_COTGL|nr:hypothetical protein KQX54_020486 [Cotesia glomerata]
MVITECASHLCFRVRSVPVGLSGVRLHAYLNPTANGSRLIHRDTRPEPAIRCSTLRGATRLPVAPDHRSEARLRIDPKVLVFVETLYSRVGREIAELLVYNRIKRSPPLFFVENRGKLKLENEDVKETPLY